MRRAVIVLPTYNEAGNISTIIDSILAITKNLANWDIEILVVDSHSPDKTGEIVKELQQKNKHLHLIEVPKEGLGKAYTTGFTYAIEKLKAFTIFEMDADGQHDSKEIPNFLKQIEQGADFVIGSRYIKGGSIPKDWGVDRKFFSIIGNLIIRLGFMKLSITDWTGGYRCIKTWVIKDAKTHIQPYTGYVFQIALLDYALKNKAVIKEIPVHFQERNHGESKISSGRYMYDILWYIFQESSFIKFVIVGGLGFVLDFGISYVLIEIMRQAVWVATLISTESAIISNFVLNNAWSFAHKSIENSRSSFVSSLLKFNLISSGSILIQTLGVALASRFFGPNLWYIYKIVIIFFIIIPYSYVLYNKVIWKDK
ncbi:MAG: glycosyltransferase [Weeksellaceae bacterium]